MTMTTDSVKPMLAAKAKGKAAKKQPVAPKPMPKGAPHDREMADDMKGGRAAMMKRRYGSGI